MMLCAGVCATQPMEAKTRTTKKSASKKSTPNYVHELTQDEYLGEYQGPKLIYFYVKNYQPCTRFSSTFRAVAAEYKDDCWFIKVNLEEFPEFIEDYSIYDVPYVLCVTASGGTFTISGEVPKDAVRQAAEMCIGGF